MAKATKQAQQAEIVVAPITMQPIRVAIVGKTPLYCHRMSAKAKQTLLLGGRKKTAAEKLHIKHHPPDEFRDSMDVDRNFHEHSAVTFPAMAVKSAMVDSALVVAGIKGTDVRRLVFLPEDRIPIFGYPLLKTDITRSADIAKTPDVRTRAFFLKWASEIVISYATPQLSETAILNLLANAGQIIGIGDFRQGKGKGSYGAFEVVTGAVPDELKDKEKQISHIDDPRAADADARAVMEQYEAAMMAGK